MENLDSNNTALLITEDADVAERVCSFFDGNEGGCKSVSVVGNFHDALEMLASSNFAVALVDCNTGMMNGKDSIRLIHHALPSLPLIALLSSDCESTGEALLREGSEEWLHIQEVNVFSMKRAVRYAIVNHRRRAYIERLLFTFEQIPAAIVISDAEGVIDYVNNRFSEITGVGREKLLAENCNSLLNCYEGNGFYARLKCCITEKSGWEGEILHVHDNGEECWWKTSISPIKSIDGLITHFVAINEDITAKKKEEEALRESEERFRTVVQNINEYIYSVSYREGIAVSTYHSPKCGEITGYFEDELNVDPRLWYSMVYDDDRDAVVSFIESILRDKKPSTIEHRIITKAGAVKWVSNTCAVEIGDDGSVVRLHGFILDITERKQKDDELRKLSQALEQSPSSVVITNTNGDIEYTNPEFSVLTGYAFEEVQGENPRILKSGYHPPEYYRDMWNTILEGGQWKGEFLNRKKSGELYWEYASISPLKNGKGEITHLIAVKQDITERKRAEESLRINEEKLRKRNEALERDLRLAQIIHRSMLPREVKKINNVKVEYRYLPMESVGGDYFWIEALNRETLSVFIGDVAGHGVSAALFLTLVKSATERIKKKRGSSPGLYLSDLNRILIEEMPSYFITAIYGVFRSGKEESGLNFLFANGGHPYPVLYRALEGDFSQLRKSSTIIGMFDEVEYAEHELNLVKGDRIFLMTDGIIEVESPERRIIGFDEGLIELFRKAHCNDLGDTLDELLAEVNDFRNGMPIEDDILLMGFEIL